MLNYKSNTGQRISFIPQLRRDPSDSWHQAIKKPGWYTKGCHRCLLILFLLGGLNISVLGQEPIKIGFLMRDKNDLTILHAAELAIGEVNKNGGYAGRKFALVTKSCEGPWGIGSKQAVALIYDDEVSIVVGALDGRNAHLAEQVTAKSHVVMISTLSSDPTLSRAYVPWYFRMVPDDRQQAELLTEQIYLEEKAKKVVVISLDNYDGKMSAEAFKDKAVEKGLPVPEVIIDMEIKELLKRVNSDTWDAVILAGTSDNVQEIIPQIQAANIYSFLNLFNFLPDNVLIDFSKIQYINPVIHDNTALKNFEFAYLEKFGKKPSPPAAYIYDGILMACEAVKQFGDDPEAIRKGFKNLKYKGITGSVVFDKFGNRNMHFRFNERLE